MANINENQQSGESQCKMILAHLQERGSITPLDALNLYGCFRLGARIFDLKEKGHKIVSGRITLPNGKRVASYKLQK